MQKMENEFVIRDYKEGDYGEIFPLWESLGLGSAHRGDDEQVISRTINMGGRLLVMVETSGSQLIGTSWLTVDGRRTYIHHFGIHADFQGKHLADKLLEVTLEIAKSIGLQIKLEVHSENLKAINLYQKAGFQYLGDYLVYIIRDISRC
jgi:ribosomal protein S18 acetylase RimI-like enzyme